MLKHYETVGMQEPTVGFCSEAAGRQGLIAGQRFVDGVSDTDLDSAATEWRSNGGD